MAVTDLVTKAQIVTLKSLGYSNFFIQDLCNVTKRGIGKIYSRALSRGYIPSSPVRLDHVKDSPRCGRPRKQETCKDEVIRKVKKDRYGREKSCEQLAFEFGGAISPTTIWRILRAAGMRKTKPTRKPGLTKAMKKARLKFCKDHEHWTLEDWKNVIWSDETSVMLGSRRGGYRIWRGAQESMTKSCIRERWKGHQEFMFWGCYSYDQKGPCHIWKPETAQEKKLADQDLENWNAKLEPIMREKWELENGMKRLALRTKRGMKPSWKWVEKTGKLTRRQKGTGVDWYRYQTYILRPKLIPFAKQCREQRPHTIVQEDKAPSHIHHSHRRLFAAAKVNQLLWPGNSPDLNMIEQCWPYLKRATTAKGAQTSRAGAEQAWKEAWNDLEQWRIQQWIECIPKHIQEVIRLEGGNEYKEGRGLGRVRQKDNASHNRGSTSREVSHGISHGASHKAPDEFCNSEAGEANYMEEEDSEWEEWLQGL